MKSLIFLFCVHLATGTFLSAQDRQTCIIVLDASNSMTGYKKGTMKMRIAQQVVGDLVTSMPDNIDLGLVVYGHRKKSDCDDIELMIPPGVVNRDAFIKTVNGIRANGKTPLTNSLKFTANALKDYASNGGSIILMTDGLETCQGDPCEVAAELKASGVNLTVHVVAFDLSEDQGRQLECIAKTTGGQFLAADDAGGLLQAMTVAIKTVSESPAALAVPQTTAAPTVVASSSAQPTAPSAPAAVIEEDPIKLTAPESVPVGSDFEVTWEGPAKPEDYLTIVPDWEKDTVHLNRSAVNRDNPVMVKALITPQVAEVRYISGVTGKVLGRTKVRLTEVGATVSGPAEAVQGNTIKVTWTGPAYEGDFVTIVPKDAEEGKYLGYDYARRDKPELEIRGLPEAGPGEIRYITGQERRTLARADINFVEAMVTLTSNKEAIAGSEVPIDWVGPANQGDFITIVPAKAEEGKFLKYTYATQGENKIKVTAPMETGEAEIRYIAGNGRATLARIPISIVKAKVTLMAPPETVMGAEVLVQWVGPANQGDFITIVPANLDDGKYLKYAYAQKGKTPIDVTAPMEAGDMEIRYLSGAGRQVLARIPIVVKEPVVTLDAPAEIVAGSRFDVNWTGPANNGDFITLVSKYADEKSYAKVAYAQNGKPSVDFIAPMDTGPMEIRYLAGADRRTLARIPIEIKQAEVIMKAVGQATVGNRIQVEWQGPGNTGDLITLVNKTAADDFHQQPVYVAKGKWTVELLAPMIPGEMEIRYLAGANHTPLKRIPLTLLPAEVSLEIPETAPVNQTITFTWSGPQNQNDLLTLVPAGSPDNHRGTISHANQGSPARINTPNEPGDYEMRYISGQDRLILARKGIKLVSAP